MGLMEQDLEQDPDYQATLKLWDEYEILRQREAEVEHYKTDEDEDYESGSGSDHNVEDDVEDEIAPKVSSLLESESYTKDLDVVVADLDEDESKEKRAYVYINTVPIIGAIYGIGRLLIKYYQGDVTEIKQTKWRIIKNLLTSLTLAATAMLVPSKKREVVMAAAATGFLEGIIDTLVDYYLLSKRERLEKPLEELMFNIMCHTPIFGLVYNFIRLIVCLCQAKYDKVTRTLWGLSINAITTGITLISIIKFSLKATGSIPFSTYTRLTVNSKSAQMKVASALVEKGATAPLIKAGKSLAARKGRKLRRKLKKDLAELKIRIDRSVENLSDEHPKVRLRKKFNCVLEQNLSRL